MRRDDARLLGPGDLVLTDTGALVMVTASRDKGAVVDGVRGDDGARIALPHTALRTKIGYTDATLPFPRRTGDTGPLPLVGVTHADVRAGQLWHRGGQPRSVVRVVAVQGLFVSVRPWASGQMFGRQVRLRRDRFECDYVPVEN